MSSKSEAAYLHAFQYIHKHVCPLDCQSFSVDFETAMQNALKKVFPGTTIISCWFHFSQAVKRNMSKMPLLFELVRANAEARTLYRKFQCIPLLPPSYILGAFTKLADAAKTLNEKAFAPFLKYYNNQWIKKVWNCLIFVQFFQYKTFIFCFISNFLEKYFISDWC